jgi:Uma2 family endonuclease
MDFSQLDLTKKYSYSDYLKWQFSEAIELIKGKVYQMSPAPLRYHQDISREIERPIFNYLYKKSCRVYHAPFDVRIPQNGEEISDETIYTVVQPDICVICDLAKLDEKGCLGAPDWIVEILSKSTSKKDLNEKFDLYESAGVKEYWVVFPGEQVISIYLLNETARYQLMGHFTDGKIKVNIFPDLELNLQEIFEQ